MCNVSSIFQIVHTMAPKKRKSRLSKGKAVADRAGNKELKRTGEKESKRDGEYRQEPSKRKNVRVASSLTPSHEDGSGRERKTNDISTPGRKYTSHFRSETMATGSSPSLLDLTVTYDYSTDVNLDDADLPRPTMQQLTQLFPFKDRSKALSSTNNVLSILHELSPAYSAPPTKRAKLRAACEKTPPSSGHPPRSKLDILLTQLQKRLSEVDQEDPLSSDADYQSKFAESESESNIDTRVEKCQEMQDNQDEIAIEKLESLDSSDNEEMLFWTQAATELESCEAKGDDPLLRDANEKAKIDESSGKNSIFDLNQAWDTEADDFIDQLLITGAEGETISSSPDPLPDTSVPTPNTRNGLPNPSIRIQPDIPTSNSKRVQSVSQATVYSKMTTDIRTSAGDRCPTPPLQLTAAQSSLSKQRANSIRSTLRRSPRRPPSWRLAKEDARSTPPLSPLTGEEKQSPLQLVGASSSQTGLATVCWGQSSYGKDNLRMPSVINVHVCSSGTGSVHNTQGCAPRVDEEKISPQPIMASYRTDSSDAATRPAVYSRGSAHIPSIVHNTTRPVAIGLSNLRGHAQSADSGVSSTGISSALSWQSSRGYTSGQVYSTQTLNCVREKNSPSKKSANIDHKYTTGNYQTTSSMGVDHRPLAKPILQSTTSYSLQHSKISPAELTTSSNTTQQQVKGNYHPTPAINVRPVTSSAVTSVHQCSQAEIERKRNLARSKLQAKKITSLQNNYHH